MIPILVTQKELTKNSSLSEYLRPRKIDDLIIDESTKLKFRQMRESGNVQNMLFYGVPGTGKTTAAQLLGNPDIHDIAYIDASINTSVTYVRETILGFATSSSLFKPKRLIILDEAEAMSSQAQNALKIIIEQISDENNFIFISNDIDKFNPAIKSRLKTVSFDPKPSNQEQFVKEFLFKVKDVLEKRNATISDKQQQQIESIVRKYYPDYRAIANELEYLGF